METYPCRDPRGIQEEANKMKKWWLMIIVAFALILTGQVGGAVGQEPADA